MIGEKERYFMEAAKRFNILWTIKTFFFFIFDSYRIVNGKNELIFKILKLYNIN